MRRQLATATIPLLRRLDAETAHRLALNALHVGLGGRDDTPDDPALAVSALGLTFRNPIGLAAGFDKDAAVLRPLMRLGFGFIEAGTLTPRPQPGNPKPSLFRLPAQRALINRLGFSSEELFAQTPALTHPAPPPRGGDAKE